jgi:imidazole glycerol-phosphate synthase subunit HisF
MSKIRVIARIDVKNDYVIKGIHLEGLRKVGKPNDLARKYYRNGIDEIVFMDAVAAYYDRNSLSHIIEEACKEVFVPITVGGGIRDVKDIQNALNAGADKVAINTKAIHKPEFIEQASKIFGSQCVVLSIDAKRVSEGKWEAYTDNGREPSGLDVIGWAKRAQQLGAGEILLTSIDAEGTKKGFDEALNYAVANVVTIPVIASGGAGKADHISSLLNNSSVDAVAVASVLHYDIHEVKDLKQQLHNHGHKVRA